MKLERPNASIDGLADDHSQLAVQRLSESTVESANRPDWHSCGTVECAKQNGSS